MRASAGQGRSYLSWPKDHAGWFSPRYPRLEPSGAETSPVGEVRASHTRPSPFANHRSGNWADFTSLRLERTSSIAVASGKVCVCIRSATA